MLKLDATKLILAFALAVVLGVPYVFRPDEADVDPNALTLVVISPHNEQIRSEFSRGFDRWHRREHGKSVIIDWRTPGGTSEIRKQLISEYLMAVRKGPIADRSMSYDIFFGGGSYEHSQTKKKVGGDAEFATSISMPAPISDSQLKEWYGENRIGRNTLYDPEKYWLGTALSAFGIVYNNDVLDYLGAEAPETWEDLTDPRLEGWIALANPGQSGSICTTFEVILQLEGWDRGWRILRESAANSRYFANSSSKVPIDVSLGEAAAGMCIDFYGRTQLKSVAEAGDPDRMGYVDPPMLTDIDPDPVSLMRGAPHPELAVRFIEFCLSEDAQALWQFPLRDADDDDALGPVKFELRRMPIRRLMYEQYADRFVDEVDPFGIARSVDRWDYNVRRTIAPIFSAMAIDNHAFLVEAWQAIQRVAPGDPRHAEMVSLLHAMPEIHLLDGRSLSLTGPPPLKEIKADWKSDEGRRTNKMERDRIEWTAFFRENYRRIIELAEKG